MICFFQGYSWLLSFSCVYSLLIFLVVLARILMTVAFLMLSFVAHEFLVCVFLIGYSWFLSCSCAFCYSWCFFSCSWFFGLYTHVFLPLIGHSWLLSCSWFFFGYSWVLFCTWVAAHAWVPLYGQLLMSVFLHMRSCLCMSTPLYEQPLMSVFAHEQLLMHEYPSEQLLMSAFFSHE